MLVLPCRMVFRWTYIDVEEEKEKLSEFNRTVRDIAGLPNRAWMKPFHIQN